MFSPPSLIKVMADAADVPHLICTTPVLQSNVPSRQGGAVLKQCCDNLGLWSNHAEVWRGVKPP